MAEYYNLITELAGKINNKIEVIAGYDPEVPKDVRRFLGRLCMLHNVPFQYLVPDGRLVAYKLKEVTMPDKTKVTQQCGALRFFWLDPVWVQALLSGALSIGEQGNASYLLEQAMEGAYSAEDFSEETARRLRNHLGDDHSPEEMKSKILLGMQQKGIPVKMLGEIPGSSDARKNWRYTGFILRSELSAVKGVEVTAMGRDKFESTEVKTIPVVRMEKIADDTLFCLCEGITTEVVIKQPSENLYFSVNDDPQYEGRDPDGHDHYIKPVKGQNISIPFRAGNKRVLNINDGDNALARKLQTITGEAISSAMVAKHMLSKPIKYTIGINWQ